MSGTNGVRDELPPGAVRQNEWIKRLGVKPEKMPQIRRDHLTSDDWFRNSAERGKPVYLTLEGQRKLSILVTAEENGADQVVSEFKEFRVLGPTPSKKYVYILVPDGDGGHLKKHCLVPMRLKHRYTKGKKIRVEVVADRDGISYRHEAFSTY